MFELIAECGALIAEWFDAGIRMFFNLEMRNLIADTRLRPFFYATKTRFFIESN
ncbi:MAG: hypothetical protein JWQ54_2868 [Mucilaginibacter sp.]|nr:hypothetical protein [Mucilaginibacter sp.]